MSNHILDKEEADKIVICYTPGRFPRTITKQAEDFVAYRAAQSHPSFEIDQHLAEQTGVSQLERISIEEKVEREALEKLKDIQEQAYQEAYQLGLDEGREQALADNRLEIERQLKSFQALLQSIERLKQDLISFNEAHIVKLVYYIAQRLAMDEIRERPELILSVLKGAIGDAEITENVSIKVSKADFEFIQSSQERLGKDLDFVKRVKIEEAENVSPGGCVVETNFGVVDATIEQRVSRLWDALNDKLPRIKAAVGDE